MSGFGERVEDFWDGYIYKLRRQRLSACVGCRCSHPIRLCLSIGVNSSFIVENINTRKIGHTKDAGISHSYAVIWGLEEILSPLFQTVKCIKLFFQH